MAKIIFTKDSETFTFSCDRVFPVKDSAQVNVAVDYSEGKQLYAYNKGVEEKFFNLVFQRLNATDYANFEEWLTDIAVGPTNTFTFTDEDSVDHTVRLLDTENPLQEISPGGFYSGTIRLREEI